jgi:hypothetical protein
MTAIQQSSPADKSPATHRTEQQGDLFEPPLPPGRRIVRGRIKFFPRKPKIANPTGNPAPFDDSLADI